MAHTIDQIKTSTQEFSDKRAVVLSLVQKLQDEIELIKRKHLPAIKAAAEEMAIAHEELFNEVKESPALFEKPKSQIIAGIRVGYKKEKGKIVIDDEELTIELIRKLLPKQAKQLIKTVESVRVKGVLDQLSAAILKQLGVKVESDTDAVFIKPIGDDIDKFVDALLQESEQILKEVA